jgi:ABC-type transporter MlaC component
MLAAAVVAPWPASAAETATVDGARAFIDDYGERTLEVIKAPSLSADERTVELGRVLIEAVDFQTLARFVLGRQGRRARGAQFEEFTRLFAAHIIDQALQRFAEMGVQGYQITKVRQLPDGDVLVTTAIANGSGEPFEAGWRVRRRNRQYRVTDLVVEGYSAAIHFRNQFERSVNSGLPGLIQKLRQLTNGSPAVALAKRQVVFH